MLWPVRLHHPNSIRHSKTWQFITPTGEATPKSGITAPKLGVNHPKSRAHATTWESITPTRQAMP